MTFLRRSQVQTSTYHEQYSSKIELPQAFHARLKQHNAMPYSDLNGSISSFRSLTARCQTLVESLVITIKLYVEGVSPSAHLAIETNSCVDIQINFKHNSNYYPFALCSHVLTSQYVNSIVHFPDKYIYIIFKGKITKFDIYFYFFNSRLYL